VIGWCDARGRGRFTASEGGGGINEKEKCAGPKKKVRELRKSGEMSQNPEPRHRVRRRVQIPTQARGSKRKGKGELVREKETS